MTSHTTKIPCPKCNSDDCNLTTEILGEAIVARISKRIIFCNSCTYTRVDVTIGGTTVLTETRLPGSDETELEYQYLGRERG